jgi:hypothetical protein
MMRPTLRVAVVAVVAVLCGLASPLYGIRSDLSAQELTDEAIELALELYNRGGTIRMSGDSRIARGTEISGDLAVLEGVLEVDGRIRGNVLLLNGQLRLGPEGRIEGAAIVIGGSVRGNLEQIAGGLTLYRGTFSYALHDDVLVRAPRRRMSELAAGRDFDFGRFDLIVTSRRGYNRVEGLPVFLGPRVTLGHSNPTLVEGLLTYRTALGFERGDLGYSVRVEQFLGGLRAARIGARAYSEIAPIEAGGVTDRESSLAAFLLHRDYRDHYERTGWSAYLRVEPANHPWRASLTFADERHAPVTARRPWSLLESSQQWRPEPLAATGRLQSISLDPEYDTRNQPNDPAYGWLLRADLEHTLDGSLRTVLDETEEPAPHRFTTGQLDVRRYARLSPSTRLAVRAFAAGSLTGDALPVQRQHALGGEGSLPGFELHQFGCGGRTSFVTVGRNTYQHYYGCDRAALVQVEYQTDLTFLSWLRSTPRGELSPLQHVRLIGFFDAGRAWTDNDERGLRSTGGDDFSADAGFGLRFGPVGFYWAVPLSGRGETMNFFVRLGPRI